MQLFGIGAWGQQALGQNGLPGVDQVVGRRVKV
jgi:hypothetical protein